MSPKAQEVAPAEILVVDDIPANLKLLTDILTERGYRVRPAGGGHLALRSVAIRLPDLVLLDVKMPDLDGYEVCRRLKSDEKSRHIPVLFVSALEDTADKVKGFDAGGVDYITKPFQADEVLARVEMHLALHRLREQLEAQNILLQLEIAERKRVEERLREEEEALSRSEAYFRSLIEKSSDMIAILNADGVICYSGPSTQHVLGYVSAELKGRSAFELVHPDDLPAMRDTFTQIVRNPGVSIHQELRFLHECGSWRTLEVVAQNLLENEAVKGIVINSHDITARKTAEDDLIRERNQLKTLLSFYRRSDTQVHDIVAFAVEECIRISESPLGFFGLVNEDETLMTAHLWSEEAMKGCAIGSKPLEFPLESAGIWAEAIRRHESLIVNDYRKPDPRKKGYPEGHVPIQRLISIPIIKEGKAVAVMAAANKDLDYSETDLLHISLFLESMWDMITRKKAEEEKEKIEAQNRQLQKAESLGRMAGAIAHHFNNQLGVVMGNLELAMFDMPQGTKPYASLASAMEASHRAAEVSGLMLIYLGQTPGKRESLDLSEICRRSLPLLRAAMPKHVAMETDLPFPGPTLSADASQIPQILTNLVINAWEAFGCEGGAIHLRVKTILSADIPATNRFPIDWQPHDNAYACLEMADAGCGIADKDIEKIFDPFFSSKFTGRGLGLSVVLGIVRAHGGVITVESEPGRGSVFRVFLPLSAEDVPRQPDKTSEACELEGGGTVLLVEDEEMLRTMAEAMLTRLGFTVLAAGDGVEAVEMFQRRQGEIRCVLCDLTMPRMNGWEVLAALRKLAPDLPVILASGYDKAHVMAGDHSEWPQAVLSKPYQLKELSDALCHALVNRTK